MVKKLFNKVVEDECGLAIQYRDKGFRRIEDAGAEAICLGIAELLKEIRKHKKR